MDKLTSMQIFVEVAKCQSFVLASENLELSAPAVTRAIAYLEKHLGIKLFNRTTRHVRLTESGQQFLIDARRILEDIEEAEAAATGVYAKPKGVLNITAPVLFGEKHIMPIITEYLEQYPDVSVRTLFSDRITGLIEEDLDVAIRIGPLKDSGLYATTVGSIRRIVCGSPKYFKRYGKPQTPTELSEHRIIHANTYDATTNWHFQRNGKNESIKMVPRLRCNQNGAAIKAAVEGFGITQLLSYQIGEELEKGNLQCILTEYEEPAFPVNVIHLEGRRTSAKNRAFIDLAVTRLRENVFINPPKQT